HEESCPQRREHGVRPFFAPAMTRKRPQDRHHCLNEPAVRDPFVLLPLKRLFPSVLMSPPAELTAVTLITNVLLKEPICAPPKLCKPVAFRAIMVLTTFADEYAV